MGGTPQMDPTANYPTVTGPYEWENYSSFAMMLQYLEQLPVFNSCNLLICPDTGFGAAQPWNYTAYNTKLNAFLCPSDPYSGIQNLCNYAACFGTTTYMPAFQVTTSVVQNQGETTGLFTIWKSYGMQSVTDGTSNTMAFAEQLVGCCGSGYNRSGPNGGNGTLYRGNMAFTPASYVPASGHVFDVSAIPNAANTVATDIQAIAAIFQQQLPKKIPDYRGYRWIMGIPGATMFNSVQTPNESIFNGSRTGPGSVSGSVGNNTDSSWSVPATSTHPGGVNVTMADGHVQFIKNSISRPIWWALSTRANGEVISSDSY